MIVYLRHSGSLLRAEGLCGEIPAIEDLLLRSRTNKELEMLIQDLKIFESVSKKFQEAKTRAADARVLFDFFIEKCPVADDSLKWNARIVRSPEFEAGR